ncbi:MAG: carboxypeptidase regulatory-like domain-containing protein, partial [Acidobacteriaceae bacterium]|nr:carboxypeptidase regulatory-like domain-containing protein [Acidobacteriaceae bacterium]
MGFVSRLTDRTVLRTAALALAFGLMAFAQRDTGAIVGTILDSSGASIPNAQIKAEDIATNFTYTAVSDARGEYVISPVRVGTYRITVSAQGFQSEVAESVTLEIQQRARMDFTLHPGDVMQTMEVTAAAPVLETDNSERGQVVTSQYMQGLPLNGRNAVQLAQLTAGVVFSEPGARDESGYGFSANGARSLENNFLLDGIDNNSNLPDLLNEANYVVMPSVDALQEFKVQTNTYSAELGRANGAVVNATLKSGTNAFHGVVYEFLRNDKLDARNFYDPARPPYKQNQFGGTLGGRIIRDRLFFFGDYEGLRVRQGLTQTSQVPTAAQRTGDFSAQLGAATSVLDCNGMPTYQGELFDTRLTQASASSPTGYCGVPFGYNANGLPTDVIPLSRQDPLAQKLLALYPLPNAVANGYNYVSNPILAQDRNQGDVRIDQVFSNKDTAFYRFSMSRSPSTIPGSFPGLADGGGFFSGVQQFNGYNGAASETHVFSPTRVNELRLGYNRLRASRFQFNYNTNVSGQIGFPGVPYSQGSDNGGLPQLTFSDASTLGSPTYLPSLEIQNTYSYSDTLTLIRGGQTWKIGGEFRPEEFTIYQPADPRGAMGFGPVFTDNAAAPGTGGSGLASFLAGQTDGGTINNLHNVDYTRKNYSIFVQNDWRVSKRLTVNL